MPKKLTPLHLLNRGQAVQAAQLAFSEAHRNWGEDRQLLVPCTMPPAEHGVIFGGHLEPSIDDWAEVEIAKMLVRVKRVCIIELQWQIDALKG